MMILNLSESLAKPLVMAKLNMAYLSSLKKRAMTMAAEILLNFAMFRTKRARTEAGQEDTSRIRRGGRCSDQLDL